MGGIGGFLSSVGRNPDAITRPFLDYGEYQLRKAQNLRAEKDQAMQEETHEIQVKQANYAIKKQEEQDTYDNKPVLLNDVVKMNFPDHLQETQKLITDKLYQMGIVEESPAGQPIIRQKNIDRMKEQIMKDPTQLYSLAVSGEKELTGHINKIDEQLSGKMVGPDGKPVKISDKDRGELTQLRNQLAQTRDGIIQHGGELAKGIKEINSMRESYEEMVNSGMVEKMDEPTRIGLMTAVKTKNPQMFMEITKEWIKAKQAESLAQVKEESKPDKAYAPSTREEYMKDFEDKERIKDKYDQRKGANSHDPYKIERVDMANRRMAHAKAMNDARVSGKIPFAIDPVTGLVTITGGSEEAKKAYQDAYDKAYVTLTKKSIKVGSIPADMLPEDSEVETKKSGNPLDIPSISYKTKDRKAQQDFYDAYNKAKSPEIKKKIFDRAKQLGVVN